MNRMQPWTNEDSPAAAVPIAVINSRPIPWPGEDRLSDDGAGEHGTELQTQNRHDRDQAVAHRVPRPRDDAASPRALVRCAPRRSARRRGAGRRRSRASFEARAPPRRRAPPSVTARQAPAARQVPCPDTGSQPRSGTRENERHQRTQPERRHRNARRARRGWPLGRSALSTMGRAHDARAAAAITIAMTIAAAASSAVCAEARADLMGDGRAFEPGNDVPRSACSERAQITPVLHRQRLVEPEARVKGRDIGRRRRTSPSIACAGSPGTAWMSAKTIVATPSTTGTDAARRRRMKTSTAPMMAGRLAK